jgi:hypothetical protein
MPDNTWFTPYALPNKDCLSMAASQGVVYKLSEHHVLKMPELTVDGVLFYSTRNLVLEF